MLDDCLDILIVDDDPLDRAAARRALHASGLSVRITELESCAAAISALKQGDYDGALLDFQLSDGTGLDVLNILVQAGVKTPIVMLTGHGDELIAVELMKAGAADYLSKAKLSPKVLGRSLQNAIRLRRAEQQINDAEIARRKSEAQFRQIAESNIIGIMFWDVSGAVTGANGALLQMIGYSQDDLDAGRIDWRNLTPSEWAQQDEDRLRDLKETGCCAPFEKEYIRHDGGRVAVLVSASMIEGSLSHGLAFVVDVTERRRAEQTQQFLAEASEILSSSLNYDETLANITGLAVPHLADWCAVDLLDDSGVVRRVSVAHSDTHKAWIAHEMNIRFPVDPDAPFGPAQVLRHGKTEWVSEITENTPFVHSVGAADLKTPPELAPTSYLCVPLMARDRVLGAITLVFSHSGRRHGEADVILAEELARRAALAVDNARLFFETKAQAERESVVNAIGLSMRCSLDADEILAAATKEVGELLGASRCGWYWSSAKRRVMEVATPQWVSEGVTPFSGVYPFSLWEPGIISRWAAGELVFVSDCAHDPAVAHYHDTFLAPLGIKAFVACPVFLRGSWAGLFVVHQTDSPRLWTEDEVALVQQIADMLAPTLENARLYAREHRVADMLQAAFLSNLPDRIADLDLGTVYRAGLDESHVGGDFYDAFLLSDGRVGLVMGDVSGKGLSAAVLTATVKFSLRAFAAEVAAPGLVMTRLNRTLRSESAGLGDHFVTLFYAVFDPGSGQLSYSSAGHETQIIKRAGGGTTHLSSTGPILGIAEHRFEQRVDHLSSGDALVLYTDGLTEARSVGNKELLDLSRVAVLIDKLAPEVGAGSIAVALEQAALEWTAGRPQDDLALLVARRTETPSDGIAVPLIEIDAGEAESIFDDEDLVGDKEMLFQFAFHSRPDYAADVRQAISHWMKTLGYRQEEIEDFQTAITEAVTNAIRHGSPQGDLDSFRVYAYRLQDICLAVDIIDSGPGLPEMAERPIMPHPEATSGRGLPLMQELSDAVHYLPTSSGMRVRLVKRRSTPGD